MKRLIIFWAIGPAAGPSESAEILHLTATVMVQVTPAGIDELLNATLLILREVNGTILVRPPCPGYL